MARLLLDRQAPSKDRRDRCLVLDQDLFLVLMDPCPDLDCPLL